MFLTSKIGPPDMICLLGSTEIAIGTGCRATSRPDNLAKPQNGAKLLQQISASLDLSTRSVRHTATEATTRYVYTYGGHW